CSRWGLVGDYITGWPCARVRIAIVTRLAREWASGHGRHRVIGALVSWHLGHASQSECPTPAQFFTDIAANHLANHRFAVIGARHGSSEVRFRACLIRECVEERFTLFRPIFGLHVGEHLVPMALVVSRNRHRYPPNFFTNPGISPIFTLLPRRLF